MQKHKPKNLHFYVGACVCQTLEWAAAWCQGRRLGRGRHKHLQQPVVLAPAGGAVAVLGHSLDELDAHFVLLELDQEPAEREDVVRDPPSMNPTPSPKFGFLLIRDVNVELVPVGGRGSGAVQLGDDLDQVFAAEQEVSFDG